MHIVWISIVCECVCACEWFTFHFYVHHQTLAPLTVTQFCMWFWFVCLTSHHAVLCCCM